MRFNITIDQVTILKNFPELAGVSKLKDVVLLFWLPSFMNADFLKTQTDSEGNLYYWIYYDYVAQELPFLGIKRDAIYRSFKKFCELGILEAHPDNMSLGKSYYRRGERFSLIDSDTAKLRARAYKNATTHGRRTDPPSVDEPTPPRLTNRPDNNTKGNNNTKSNTSSNKFDTEKDETKTKTTRKRKTDKKNKTGSAQPITNGYAVMPVTKQESAICQKIFEKSWQKSFSGKFPWDAKEGKNLKLLVGKVKTQMQGAGIELDTKTLVDNFTAFMEGMHNVRAWYRENHFSPSGINSQFVKILNELNRKDGKGKSNLNNLYERSGEFLDFDLRNSKR